MTIKGTVVKLTLTSLAAGALLVGGLASATSASAEEPHWQAVYPEKQAFPGPTPTPSPVQYYNPYTTQLQSPVFGFPYGVYNSYLNNAWLGYFYNYTGYNYNQAYAQARYNRAVASSVVSASAVALNLSVADVNARLASGRTLAQIAAERGVARQNFVNAVNSILQTQIGAAVQARLITPAAGVSLSAAVATQVNVIVDRHGPALLAGI